MQTHLRKMYIPVISGCCYSTYRLSGVQEPLAGELLDEMISWLPSCSNILLFYLFHDDLGECHDTNKYWI